MKKLLFLVLFTLPVVGWGQEVVSSLYVVGGVGGTTFEVRPESDNVSSGMILAPSVGVRVSADLGRWSFLPGLLYQHRGFQESAGDGLYRGTLRMQVLASEIGFAYRPGRRVAVGAGFVHGISLATHASARIADLRADERVRPTLTNEMAVQGMLGIRAGRAWVWLSYKHGLNDLAPGDAPGSWRSRTALVEVGWPLFGW